MGFLEIKSDRNIQKNSALLISIKLLSMFDRSNIFYSKIPKSKNLTSKPQVADLKHSSSSNQCLIFHFHKIPIEMPKKERLQIPQSHIFLLIQYREEIKMSFNYSETILDLIPQQFDRFLSQMPPEVPKLASILPNHRFKKEIESFTPLQARQTLLRLVEKSKASSVRKNWKVDETNYLLFVVQRYCLANGRHSQQLDSQDWQSIASLVPNRDSSACEFRYLSLCPASITHTPWSAEERELLLRIIQNHNSNGLNWKRISQKLYELSKEKVFRTGKQCREHYTCFLRPNLKKGAWTDEQDFELMGLFLKLGKKWSKMTKFIDGRNENSIKNRFFLIFESKNQIRYSNSDLVKMVRRRMDKISKKLSLAHQQKCLSEQNINMTPTNSDSSNFETERQNYEGERFQGNSFHTEIFFNECQEGHSQGGVKIEEEGGLFANNQEFERYIDL